MEVRFPVRGQTNSLGLFLCFGISIVASRALAWSNNCFAISRRLAAALSTSVIVRNSDTANHLEINRCRSNEAAILPYSLSWQISAVTGDGTFNLCNCFLFAVFDLVEIVVFLDRTLQ